MKTSLSEVTQKFWSKVSIGEPDECWPWQGPIAPSLGYGTFKVRGFGFDHSHRTAWELTHGKIGDRRLVVCHKCDNRPCCNPNHMFLGTRRQNNEDRHGKGRSRNGNHKLTEPEVQAIREAYRDPSSSLSGLSRRFAISLVQIRRIVLSEQWKRDGVEAQAIHIPPAHRTFSEETVTAALNEYQSGTDPLSHVARRYGISQTRLQRIATERGIESRRVYRKIGPDQAAEIRALYATGDYTKIALALRFGVADSFIGRIVKGTAIV